MNNIGLHYGYWLHDWDGDLLTAIDKAAEIGFDTVEIDSDIVLNRTSVVREKIRRWAEDRGVELTFCIGMKGGFDISSANKRVRKRGVEHVKKIITVVNEMGGKTISGVNYGEWNPAVEKAEKKQEYLQRSRESIKEIVKIAEKAGVFYNIEPVNRFEQFMINTCQEALEFIEPIDSPNLKILLDTFHMNIEEDSFREAIMKAGDKLGHIHIGENNRKPPGEGGVLDWDTIFNSLKEIDYGGSIVMEPFIISGGEIARDIRVWRDMTAEKEGLEDRIADSLKFVRNKLK
ncbi:MAG: sugar phosphate isomerase/epimerase family protein [Halanaerobiales bacterium]